MRIDLGSSGMQTSTAPQNSGVSIRTVSEQPIQPVQQKSMDSESYSEFSHKPTQELTMDEQHWIKLMERANKAIVGANKTFEYSIHEQTKEIMIKVKDRDTNEVLMEIPSEKILNMVAKMWEMAGLFVDERR